MINSLKKIWHDFISGPQWRKDPPLFQIRKNGQRHKSFFVFLWYWCNSLLDLCLTRQARLLFLIWLALTSYSLTMMPDSMPALWLFMSAAAIIDLPAKLIFRPKLTLSRTMPQRVKCAQPFRVQYHITNNSSMPCHALLPDAYFLCDSFTDILPAQNDLAADIPSNTSVLHEIQYVAKRRGIICCTRPVAETSYPFHMFKRSLRYGRREEIIVLPYCRIMPELSSLFPQDAAEDEDDTDVRTGSASGNGDGQEFYACRDYHTGDQPKRIHWKRTAQRNKLTVREYEREGTGKAAVLLLNSGVRKRNFLKTLAVPQIEKDLRFEAAVSLCASTLQTLEENAIPAELYLSDPGSGVCGDEAMDELAVTERGLDTVSAANILLSGDRIRQFIAIYLIVTDYDQDIAALHRKIMTASRVRVNILLVTAADEKRPPADDIFCCRLDDLLPEVLL